MSRCTFAKALAALILFSLAACDDKDLLPMAPRKSAASGDHGGPVRAPIDKQPLHSTDDPKAGLRLPTSPQARDPIVVPGARLTAIEKEDVPGQQDGFLLFVGTEIKPGETVPPDRRGTVRLGAEGKLYRRLKEDDAIEAGQLLGQLDDRLARNELAIKNARLASVRADLAACQKTRDEAEKRYETQLKLQSASGLATSEEEVRTARLNWEKAHFDVINKQEGVSLAVQELVQAQTLLQMHEIRSHISGVLKSILKSPGEAIRRSEPVFQVQNLARLRAEGLVAVEHVPRLRPGMRAFIEPTEAASPDRVLRGHLREITGVAVSGDQNRSLVVSASEDATVRIWDLNSGQEIASLRHPAAVRCIACSGSRSRAPRCISGSADGIGRIWDLQQPAAGPLCELTGQHRGAIGAVAFSDDGKSCATGGDDWQINVWDTASGKLRYRLPAGHRGAITSLHFSTDRQLVSFGHDNTVRVWNLAETTAQPAGMLDRRSGDVSQLGVSPDGKLVLFDQDSSLRLVGWSDGRPTAILQNPSEPAAAAFASVSPDGRLVLAGSQAQGRLQLWQIPKSTWRAQEWRLLVFPETARATCGAFSLDGAFVVAGTEDRQVLIWRIPRSERADSPIVAEVTRIEPAVDSTLRQVRIWAEVANEHRRLLPGATVTLAIYPDN